MISRLGISRPVKRAFEATRRSERMRSEFSDWRERVTIQGLHWGPRRSRARITITSGSTAVDETSQRAQEVSDRQTRETAGHERVWING